MKTTWGLFVGAILMWLLITFAIVGKCSRCGYECRESSMKVSRYSGKETIHLCPRCQYVQDASFLRFCPVEEGE
jgi:hypothetical protein